MSNLLTCIIYTKECLSLQGCRARGSSSLPSSSSSPLFISLSPLFCFSLHLMPNFINVHRPLLGILRRKVARDETYSQTQRHRPTHTDRQTVRQTDRHSRGKRKSVPGSMRYKKGLKRRPKKRGKRGRRNKERST